MYSRHRTLLPAISAVFLILACLPAWAVAPTVTNVQAHQWQDGTGKVQITYYLTDPDTASVYVSVAISNDGGSTYSITPTTFSGTPDTGWVRPGGTRTIVWDAKADYPTAVWTSCKAKVTADDASGGVYPGTMVYIPAGSFRMGNNGSEPYSYSDELPQHWVNLSSYYIGKYEVTRGEYRAFMNAGGYTTQSYWSTDGWSWKGSKTQPTSWWVDPVTWGTPPGQFSQGDSRPVVGVTYYEAEAFCNWAGGHLPTEAQWERAARWTGTHANVYPWGDAWDQQRCNNWYDTLYPGYQTAPVGSYSSYPSPSGCQDMAGNVWEWCKDWYLSTYYSTSPPSDPQGPTSGSSRVLRGGSWYYDDCYFFRCAYRNCLFPDNDWYRMIGFRLAR